MLATVVAESAPAPAFAGSVNALLVVVVGLPRDIVEDLQLHFNRWFQLAPLELTTPLQTLPRGDPMRLALLFLSRVVVHDHHHVVS